MDKIDTFNTLSHVVTINERSNIVITGVKKIESFDVDEVLMETTRGFIKVTGEELEIIKLDTYQGNVSIKGHVDSFNYLDNFSKKDKDNSFISKLFK
jgi:sporulation protein YabP